VTAGCQTKTVPPVMKVTYASTLSEEPLLVQSFSVSGSNKEFIHNAIVKSALNRQWTITDNQTGIVSCQLTHRAYDSTLTFKYNKEKVEIYSVSYKINKSTQKRIKRSEPDDWIRNLQKDILVLLGAY
jgi:hypothetical protein